AVVRITQALYQPGLLEAVEPVGHRPARQLEALGKLARGGAARRAGLAVEVAQDLPLAPGQAVLRARLLHHPLDPSAQTHDAVDDPLDLEIEVGQLVPDRLQEVIDVVAFDGLGHRRNYSTTNLLTSRDMVVSLSISKYSKSRNRRWRDVLRRRLTKDPGRRPHRGAGA